MKQLLRKIKARINRHIDDTIVWLDQYNSPIEKKRRKLYKIISADDNLNKIGIQKTVRTIVDNFVAAYPLDFIYREIASFIVNIGQAYYARPYFKRALKINNQPLIYSLYLQGLLIDPFCDEKEIYREAIQYNSYYKHIKKYTTYNNVKDPYKKLNVGYVCHFFYNSVSQSLLVPFLKQHNRNRVKVFCYSDADVQQVNPDTRTAADVWHDTKGLSDEVLSNLIRNDEIDILLELNGHVLSNRYSVIARKPAPIQINYYNQSATTGMDTFDYILVGEDIHLNQSNYTETIHKISGVQGVSIFPEWFPPVAVAPSQTRNHIVFGSFGAAHKVNTQVIKLWSKILHALPQSQLFMKAGVLTYDAYLDVYKREFSDNGIDVNRIRFEGFSDHLTMLKCYADVDIALDTFPHAAGTTTMEALWQGVPVITLCGSERYCSQNGRIVLGAVGHPELVAYSEEEYIEKAIALARDKQRLLHYRNTLRDDFKRSTLADAKSFATRLEDTYYELWHRYCQSS